MTSPAPTRRRSTPPEPGPIRPFHLPELEAHRLDSGLEVRSMARSEVPLVSLCLIVDAGETTVGPEQAGLAVLTGDALSGGTEERSGAELAEALEGLGTNLRVSTGWDATTLSVTCVAERLDATLELLAEVVRRPSFPDSEVDRVRRQRLAAIRQRTMDPGHLASDELDRTLYPPEHPCHRPLSGRPESLEAMERTGPVEFVRARYRPEGAGFVVVGDLSGADVLERARARFGDWEGSAAPRPELSPVSLPDARPVVLVHREGAVQSEIRIGHPGPARGSDLENALEVGNAVLGGAFTSRLNLSLREKHGFTYGVRSRFERRRGGGTFSISTAVETGSTAQALNEAMDEFRRFVAEGPTTEEVEQARDYLAGIFPLRMETAPQLASRLAEILIFELPDEYHHRYRERVRAVTARGVRDAMQATLDPERAPIVVTGDADALRGELEALGMGPVEVREAEGSGEDT